jgi:secondary thiamine-phosphate synthase enzyme
MMTIHVNTEDKRQIVDITAYIEGHLKGSGLANILLLHTTAAVTVADLDPGTDQDYLDALESITPDKKWNHPHDPSHFPDHLWSSLIGPSTTLPYKNDKLILGTWQRVILIELDGPRQRTLELSLIKG